MGFIFEGLGFRVCGSFGLRISHRLRIDCRIWGVDYRVSDLVVTPPKGEAIQESTNVLALQVRDDIVRDGFLLYEGAVESQAEQLEVQSLAHFLGHAIIDSASHNEHLYAVSTPLQSDTSTRTHTYTQRHKDTKTYTYTHTRTNTQTHTHKHTHKQKDTKTKHTKKQTQKDTYKRIQNIIRIHSWMHICTAYHWSNRLTSFRGGRVFGSQPLHRRRPRNGFPEDSMSNAVKRDATAPVPAVSSKVQLIRGLVGNRQQPSETRFFPAQNKALPTTRIEQNQPENVCKESESKGKL